MAPQPLEIGKHTVTLYAITPDGIRSPDLTIPFEIKEDSLHGIAPGEFLTVILDLLFGNPIAIAINLLLFILLLLYLIYQSIKKRKKTNEENINQNNQDQTEKKQVEDKKPESIPKK